MSKPGRRAAFGALRTLSAVIRDPANTELLLGATSDQVSELISLARAHGVEGWLAVYAPRESGWAVLSEQRTRFVAARARAKGELAQFEVVASQVGCRWVVVKGQALSEDVYPSPQIRHGVDIDVLVEPAAFPELLAALIERGWQLMDVNWPLLERTKPGQLRVVSPTGGLFDLHWNLLNNPLLRRSFPLPTAELLSRSRVLRSGLPVLDRNDQLVHLGLHGALSGANRLVWLADAGLAARSIPDWATLVDAAQSGTAGPPLAMVLMRANRWLGTPAPREVLSQLGVGGLWRGIDRLVDKVSPLDADPDRPAFSRAWSRSVRGGALATTEEFARHLAGFMKSGAPRVRGPSLISDPANDQSPLHPVADAAAQARYLEFAAAG